MNTDNKTLKISQTLVVRPPDRSPKDIAKWRSAMMQADRGRRHTLINLYNDLLSSDNVLADAVDKRIRNITNAKLVFMKDSKEVDEMWDLIDTLEFEEFITELMLTKFYGKTVIELDFTNGFNFTSIDRRHLDTENKCILRSLADADGIPYNVEDDFLINLGKDDDLGIYLRTAPYAIFKRNGGSDYAQFCELFGIPQMAGYYDPEDDNGRREMETAFQNRGAGASMTMSNKSKVETLGDRVNGNSDVHERFLDWCDEQMLIGVVSQTMTTKDGSSYSQGKVHGDVENDLNKADRRFIRRILNTYLLPRLEKRGYPVKGGFFDFIEEDEKLNAKDLLDIATTIDDRTTSGVDEDWYFETFGVPKGTKEKKTEKEINEIDNADSENNTETEKTENSRTEKAKALSLYNRIKDFFGDAPR